MHKNAKIGITTPDKTEISLPSENVSDIYEGIQVVTPSRSEPWIIMAAIINTKAAAVQFTAFPLFSLSLLFTFSLVFKPPHKTSHIAAVINPANAENKNIDFQPESLIKSGAIKYTAILPKCPPHEIRTPALS